MTEKIFIPLTNYISPTVGFIQLTKREYFAALAMQALIAKSPYFDQSNSSDNEMNDACEGTSEGAVAYADSLLKSLGEHR